MDRKTLMEAVAARAFELRIELPRLCTLSGLSARTADRYMKQGKPPLLETIGKLERTLDAMEDQ